MKEHLSFEESISYSISYHQLLAPQERVLVALSGGADSVALLRVLLALGYVCEAAHCNFHLRAADSDQDAAFVSQLCATLNVKLHNADFDTKKYAADNHVSIEMAARDLRYAFFNEICTQQNIQKIAVGHHEEDCVETVLLNLTRGTGIRGLTGIHFVNDNIIRPMLGVDRTEIEDYLSSLGQDYVTDKTNMIDDVARNQIRLNVIPCLKRINPSVSQAIYSASRRLNAVCSIYESAISEAKARVMCNNVISLKKLCLESYPETILYELLYPLGFSSSLIEQIYSTRNGEPGHVFESDQWRLLRDREKLILRSKKSDFTLSPIVLPLEGLVHISDKYVLNISRIVVDKPFCVPKVKNAAYFDLTKIIFPITVRSLKIGDKFVPYGMNTAKLVSDYMTDCKFTLFQKEQQTVVCFGDKIAWLVNERTDNRFAVDEQTRTILVMKIEQ